jgi:hypothetical protein
VGQFWRWGTYRRRWVLLIVLGDVEDVESCCRRLGEAERCWGLHVMQRRCYWLLKGNDSIVLVHYLAVKPKSHPRLGSHSTLTGAGLFLDRFEKLHIVAIYHVGNCNCAKMQNRRRHFSLSKLVLPTCSTMAHVICVCHT